MFKTRYLTTGSAEDVHLEVSRWWERKRVNQMGRPSHSARDSLKRVDKTMVFIVAKKGVVSRLRKSWFC